MSPAKHGLRCIKDEVIDVSYIMGDEFSPGRILEAYIGLQLQQFQPQYLKKQFKLPNQSQVPFQLMLEIDIGSQWPELKIRDKDPLTDSRREEKKDANDDE